MSRKVDLIERLDKVLAEKDALTDWLKTRRSRDEVLVAQTRLRVLSNTSREIQTELSREKSRHANKMRDWDQRVRTMFSELVRQYVGEEAFQRLWVEARERTKELPREEIQEPAVAIDEIAPAPHTHSWKSDGIMEICETCGFPKPSSW